MKITPDPWFPFGRDRKQVIRDYGIEAYAHYLAKTANHQKFQKVVAMISLSCTDICGERFQMSVIWERQFSGGNGRSSGRGTTVTIRLPHRFTDRPEVSDEFPPAAPPGTPAAPPTQEPGLGEK